MKADQVKCPHENAGGNNHCFCSVKVGHKGCCYCGVCEEEVLAELELESTILQDEFEDDGSEENLDYSL